MKKFLSVFIPVILLTATMGVYVVNHYCMITGKTTANYSCCSRCSDECCKKDIKVVRLTIESVKQSESELLFAFSFVPPAIAVPPVPVILAEQDAALPHLFHPVPLTGIISTVVLRI